MNKTLLILVTFVVGMIMQASSLACTGIVLHAKDGAVVPARTMEFSFDVESNILVVPAGTKITKLIMDEKNTGGTYVA